MPIGLFWGLKELIYVKYSKQCLAHIISSHKILVCIFKGLSRQSMRTSNSSYLVAIPYGISNMLAGSIPITLPFRRIYTKFTYFQMHWIDWPKKHFLSSEYLALNAGVECICSKSLCVIKPEELWSFFPFCKTTILLLTVLSCQWWLESQTITLCIL